MANTDIWALSKNAEFRKIVSASIEKAASQISGENPLLLTAVWAQKRHALATKVILNVQGYAMIFAGICSAQAGLYSTITINPDGSLTSSGDIDSDTDFTVNAVWDGVAGISYDEKQP